MSFDLLAPPGRKEARNKNQTSAGRKQQELDRLVIIRSLYVTLDDQIQFSFFKKIERKLFDSFKFK